MDGRNEPEKLPRMSELHGMYFNSNTEMVEVGFSSEGKHYVLEIPIAEILKSEIWFIKMREHLTGLRRYGPFDDAKAQ